MLDSVPTRLLAKCDHNAFAGRSIELDRLIANSASNWATHMVAEPGAGQTELLTQLFDRLFFAGGGSIPFYFSFDLHTPLDEVADRFFDCLLLQIVAFRRHEARLLHSGLTRAETIAKVPAADRAVIKGLLRYYGERDPGERPGEALRRVLNAPARAVAAGLNVLPIIDIARGSGVLAAQVSETFFGSRLPYILASDHMAPEEDGSCRMLDLRRLSVEDCSKVVKDLGTRFGVEVSDGSADLIALKFGGDLRWIESFIASAAGSGAGLTDLRAFSKTYAEEVFSGSLAEIFHNLMTLSAGSPSVRENVIRFLGEQALTRKAAGFTHYEFAQALGTDEKKAASSLQPLADAGVLKERVGRIFFDLRAETFLDLAAFHSQVRAPGMTFALAAANASVEFARKMPMLMERYYRRNNSAHIAEFLELFDGQLIAPAMLDHEIFASEYKGLNEEFIFADLVRPREGHIKLPNIYYVAATTDVYPPMARVAESFRSAVGVGFNGTPGDRNAATWIAVEIDSKLEVTREKAEFWCDRLEMAAVMSALENCRLWLIAPEGFDAEAHRLLKERRAVGSSRQQLRLLRRALGSVMPAQGLEEDLEITLPMDENSELIAARIAEDIARKHDFDPRSINQIKTALIEAFINAAEHSLSPDKKVHQRFRFDGDSLTITISNRGLRLRPGDERAAGKEKRRGMGLDLMRKLMDEVTVEESDDGTRISMTKRLVRSETRPVAA